MPRARENGVLALGAVYAEELIGFVVCVCGSYRHNLHTHAQFQLRQEYLLYIELLKSYLPAAFYFAIVFAGFLRFYFYGRFGATVLEFDFRRKGPAFSEIITEIDNHMRQIKASVAAFVLVRFGIPQIIVTVKITGESHLAVASDMQSVQCRRLGLSHAGILGIDRR